MSSSSAAAPPTCRPGWPGRALAWSVSIIPSGSSTLRASSSVDLAISEYGASIWCDPYRWIPEAARLLRPGGLLVFLKNGLLRLLTTPDDGERAGERLVRAAFGLHRVDWSDDGSVEFDLPHGEWIRLFRASGFRIERLAELQAPAGGSPGRYTFVTLEWARRWPSEEIWVVRKE
jgi:SAM-dependent methyltransferase